MIAYTAYATDGRVRLEAESLARWGYEICFLVLRSERRPREYSLCGVNVIELNVRKYQGKNKLFYLLSYLHFLLLAFIGCTSLFFRKRFQVIHVHNMPDLLVFAGLIPRLFGCKIVLDIHDSIPETYGGKFAVPSSILFRILALEERLSCAFAHRVICVNHIQQHTIEARGIPGDKLCTVITMPTFSGMNAQLESNGSRFRLVNHGTVSNRLGIDLLVRAAARLANTIPGFELHLIGAGDDLDDVSRLVQSLGLSGYTHIHGSVRWDALPDALASMDVGIVANRSNIATRLMLPSKLIDFAVLGIPAVVPKLPAIQYYFTTEMVSYFEPEDVDSMVSAVAALYYDRDRRRRQVMAAHHLFTEKYSWQNSTVLRDLYAILCPMAIPTDKVDRTVERVGT